MGCNQELCPQVFKMTAIKGQGFNVDVAILRAFAVLIVIGYHFFPSYLPWGFVGVDIFFVISGFLILRILHSDDDLLGFYINRLRRIYPPLLVLLLAVNAFGFVTLLVDELLKLVDASIASLLQYQNIREMLNEGYFVDAVNFRPLLHIWSLSVEYQFYFLFPFLLWLINRLRQTVPAMLIIVLGISLLACLIGSVVFNLDVFFIAPFRFWEFLAGAACFVYTTRQTRRPKSSIIFVAFSIVFFVLAAYGARPLAGYPGFWGIFPVLGACCFIIGKPSSYSSSNFIKPALYVAGISYSLYLFHFPGLEFLRQFYGPPSVAQRLVLLVMVFVVAHLVDRMFMPKLLNLKKGTAIILVVSVVMLVGLLVSRPLVKFISRSVVENNFSIGAGNTFKVDYREDCQFLGLAPHKEDRCRVKKIDGSHPKLIIVGDSLSNALTTVFDEIGKDNDRFGSYVQIGRGLCPAIKGAGDKECDEFAAEVLNYVDRLPPSVPVVFAGQWPLYVKKPNFESQLDAVLQRLSANGRHVVFVHAVPLGAMPRTCVARFPGVEVGHCDIPIAKAHEREEGYKTALKSVLVRNRVIEFEPSDWLCDKDSCVVYAGNQILYLDDSHLSSHGGAELGRRSKAWWDDALQARGAD